MKPYLIVKSGLPKTVSALVVATNNVAPTQFIDDLQEELVKANIEGTIVLDLLTCFGSESRRFFQVPATQRGLDIDRFEPVTAPSQAVVEAAKRVYADARPFFDFSLVQKEDLQSLVHSKVLPETVL